MATTPRDARGRPAATAVGGGKLLRIPLLAKLVGTHLLVGIVAGAAILLGRSPESDDGIATLALTGVFASVVLGAMLVKVALEPLERLRNTLREFARGDASVRIRPSAVADRGLLDVGEDVNDLLDDLVAERGRLRRLARETIRSADEERARISRGLHESTAQLLAALSLEARLALQLDRGPELTAQLELIKDLAVDALVEVRDFSQSIHPRVLDDLGLAAALGWLVRCARESGGLETTVELRGGTERIPADVGCALYRVAEAALDWAGGPGAARRARLEMAVTAAGVRLDVQHDGQGGDRPPQQFEMLRERLALSGGSLTVHSGAGGDAHVRASVPFHSETS